MSGIQTRLAKLERAVRAAAEIPCSGCVALPARFVVEFPHQPPPPELDEDGPRPIRDEYRVRCEVCGRDQTGTTVVMHLLGHELMKDFNHGMSQAV